MAKNEMLCDVLSHRGYENERPYSHACLPSISSLRDYRLPISQPYPLYITPFDLCPTNEGLSSINFTPFDSSTLLVRVSSMHIFHPFQLMYPS